MTTRIFALDSLDATKTDWEIEVQVKQKEDLRSYNNSKGSGFVFDVILADKKVSDYLFKVFNYLVALLIHSLTFLTGFLCRISK